MPRVTIIETGLVSPANRERHGSYPQMFEAMIAAADPTVTFGTVSVPAGEKLPDASGLEAILITGSSAGVYDDFDWIAPLEAFVRTAHARKVPMVGVCFGHQLVAHALGGRVAALPTCSEYGTIEVKATPAADADPVFQGAPKTFKAQAAHSQTVADLPRGAKLLAENGFGVQAARMADTVWGLQFHPEFDLGFMRVLFKTYASYMAGIGIDVDTESTRLADSPMALRVLRNFANLVKPRII